MLTTPGKGGGGGLTSIKQVFGTNSWCANGLSRPASKTRLPHRDEVDRRRDSD